MAVNIQSSKLDFTNIKNQLKTHFAADAEWSDYNFEAAGLSNILDVLAYNTHYNALIANFALNESFLSTAQLRSSVVAHATSLGYNIRSVTAARATVNLAANLLGIANRPATITLPVGFRFNAAIGDVTFTFQTRDTYYASDDGFGVYQFRDSVGNNNIVIYEGTNTTKNFIVGEKGERQLYIIPDQTIDTSTAIVKVYDSTTTSAYTSYQSINTATAVTGQSTFYQLSESPNGNYELNFGDGISFGRSPSAGNKVEVDYLATVGPEANGASIFNPISQLSIPIGPGSTTAILNVTTVADSNSGASRQTIESIRNNAPIAFATQQRLVTADDYKAIILQNYSSVTDAISWGGEDNVPTRYGSVFVSLNFQDGTSTDQKQAVKDSIVANITDNLSIMSVETVFADPIDTFLEVQCIFNFDPALSGLTVQATEGQIFPQIVEYFATNLSSFGKVWRRSELLSTIDDIGPAILNSNINVKIQQRLIPTVGTSKSYKIYFPVSLAEPDDVNGIISSSTFVQGGKTCSIINQLGTNKLQVVDTTGAPVIDNIGLYDPGTGIVTLTGFAPEQITSGQTFIKISALPANQSTIRPLRNYIIKLDQDISFTSGALDRQTLQVSL
tara:strand:- start:6158 stop:8005 length:1848 start_codon:yes stop_codon:yes gene_type:complete